MREAASASKASASKYVGYLAAFYRWASIEGFTADNPAEALLRACGERLEDTSEAALRDFETYQRRRNLSPSTITHRRFRVRAFGHWLGARSLLEATTGDIELWLDGHRLGAQARYTYIGYLSAFYRWASAHGVIAEDPTIEVERPRLPRFLPRPIPDNDLADAMRQAEPRMAAFLALASYQGLRCKEIAALCVQDVQLHQQPPALRVEQGKGQRDRVMPLHEETRAALSRYGLPRSGHVFHRLNGQPLQAGTVSRYIGRYLHDLGIAATAHQCRHWMATKVYDESGGDILLTQQLLGHASPATTAIYAKVSTLKAAEVMARLSCGPAPVATR